MHIQSDNTATVDLLNRTDFAKNIAAGVINSSKTDQEGFVVGLTGKWGSGKSTLLDFVKDELIKSAIENNINHQIIEFNPWIFTDEENIKKAFLKEFSLQISNNTIAGIKRHGKKIFSPLKFIADKSKITFAKEAIEAIEKYLDSNTSLSYKKTIDRLLIRSNKKIFIFIDDIDRLLPKQVFEILQVLKLSGNFKNTYYIIAFDREAVEISIESQFKDYGRKYLDKIIQADFLIPEITSEKIEEIFFLQLKELLGELSIHYNLGNFISVWSHKGFRNYFKTLREVYRYFNSLKFRLPPIKDDINLTDFLIIEAIRLYDFAAYEKIYADYSFKFMTIGNSNPKYDGSELSVYPHTLTLQQYLFSQDQYGFHNSGLNQKRLCDSAYFDRYFTLTVNSNDIIEKDLRIIIEEREGRKEKLIFLLNQNRIRNLMGRLQDKNLIEYYPIWDFSLIRDLFDFFDENSIILGDSNNYTCDAILNLLQVNEAKRINYFDQFLKHLILETASVSNARAYFAHYIVLNEKRNTGFGDGYVHIKLFFMENCEPVKKFYFYYLTQWKGYYLKQRLPNEKFDFYTLIFMADFATYFDSEYLDLASELLNDKKACLFYLRQFLHNYDSKPDRIRYENVNLILPGILLSKFVESLKRLSESNLTGNEKAQKDFFLSVIQIADKPIIPKE